MQISIITAFDQNQVIGQNNQLPWHIPEDLKHFKTLTQGQTIIMGRKTFESIGRPLPNRKNIIISNAFKSPDLKILRSPNEALSLPDEHIFIIGGSSIYRYFLPYCHNLYITHIDKSFPGDCYFPTIDWHRWQTISEDKLENSAYDFDVRFCHYQRLNLSA